MSDRTTCSSNLFECERESYFLYYSDINFCRCAGSKYDKCPCNFKTPDTQNERQF